MSDPKTAPEEQYADTNAPWRRSSMVRFSIAPKDFRVEMVTRRKGTVPRIALAGEPTGGGAEEDHENTTTIKVTGDLGIEINREATGQGIEYEQESDDDGKGGSADWADMLNQILAAVGGAFATRGGCFPGATVTPSNPFPPGMFAPGIRPDMPSLADQVMFGAGAPEVVKLRADVARRGEKDAVPPEGLATLLIRVAEKGWGGGAEGPKPKAYDLFANARWVDLVEALLPDAPAAYCDQIIDALEKLTGKENAA